MREMNWVWAIGAPLVRAIMSIACRVRIEGVEHVPRTGPVIVAPNHVSVLDGPAVSAVVGTHRWRATRNLIAAELFRGVTGWILRQAHQVPIRRGSGDTGALDEAIDAVRAGSCVGIFPEGRVSDDPRGGLQRIRSGLTRVAMPTGAPVVPVGIWGTHHLWPKEGLDRPALRRRPTIAIVFGRALEAHPDEPPGEFRERYRAELDAVVTRARTITGDPA